MKRAWLQDPWKCILHLLVIFHQNCWVAPYVADQKACKSWSWVQVAFASIYIQNFYSIWQFSSWFRNFHEENPTTWCQLACKHNRFFGAIFKHLKWLYTPGVEGFLRSLNTIHAIKLKFKLVMKWALSQKGSKDFITQPSYLMGLEKLAPQKCPVKEEKGN